MADQVPATVPDQALLSREVNRRNFLKGATSQVVKHSLVTVPAVALVLSGATIPASAQSAYGSTSTGSSFFETLLRYLGNITRRSRNLSGPTDANAIRG